MKIVEVGVFRCGAKSGAKISKEKLKKNEENKDILYFLQYIYKHKAF